METRIIRSVNNQESLVKHAKDMILLSLIKIIHLTWIAHVLLLSLFLNDVANILT